MEQMLNINIQTQIQFTRRKSNMDMNEIMNNLMLAKMAERQLMKKCSCCGKRYRDVYDKDVSKLNICFRCYMDGEYDE